MSDSNQLGDNRELGLPTIGDYTFYFADTTKTSADDTASTKYFDNRGARTQFCLRSNQICQIVSVNNETFTEPYTCPINGSLTEGDLKGQNVFIFTMVIRTTVANTNIKLRVRGGFS